MKKIILILLPILIAVLAFKNSRQVTITGYVTNSRGEAVVAATVSAGAQACLTNSNGYYSILVSEKNIYLHFSAVGYQSQKVKINKQIQINVVMADTKAPLDEVVVSTGHIKKTVKSEELYASVTMTDKSSVGYSGSPAPYEQEFNTEEYSNIAENGFHKVKDDPLSTFSIDVDAASYSNVRRYLNNNQLPPTGAVRTEEMINYFKYNYPQPTGKDPFSINTEMSDCPWNKNNKLVLIGLQGKTIPYNNLPASNLVFLIDVSGSMMDENKLPLVKQSMKLLTDQLRENDKISIVVYAGNAGMVLPATSGANKIKIKEAIDGLEAGGSTAGGEGIKLAYKIAQNNFMKDGNNRIILCTDGDFNVGESSDAAMVKLIEGERDNGIFLTVLGYGMGNYKDSKMEELADKGNGNHAYIDGINEAKKVLVNEFGGTLFTIAKDVKLQVEFNPAKVAGYRLIGYENRMLNKEDFNNDKKDAGELGSGHTVTALYEIIPTGVESEFLKNVDPLKYQQTNKIATSDFNDEMLTVKFRYKNPGNEKSELIVHPLADRNIALNNTSDNFRFATAVSGFAMLLRNSEYKGNCSFESVMALAKSAIGTDAEGYRKEFIGLLQKAEGLEKSKVVN
ncbi:MAG: von Willebrand factor type A domain-containing protein [Bacteroidetes bacterium]|nr:von Willebrand factor type A domain-containing protein [Bacteroidota bacterium]MBS1756018.1 von Willebrand factor type A domain-containing protein [Bacteroidota bacterium]